MTAAWKPSGKTEAIDPARRHFPPMAENEPDLRDKPGGSAAGR